VGSTQVSCEEYKQSKEALWHEGTSIGMFAVTALTGIVLNEEGPAVKLGFDGLDLNPSSRTQLMSEDMSVTRYVTLESMYEKATEERNSKRQTHDNAANENMKTFNDDEKTMQSNLIKNFEAFKLDEDTTPFAKMLLIQTSENQIKIIVNLIRPVIDNFINGVNGDANFQYTKELYMSNFKSFFRDIKEKDQIGKDKRDEMESEYSEVWKGHWEAVKQHCAMEYLMHGYKEMSNIFKPTSVILRTAIAKVVIENKKNNKDPTSIEPDAIRNSLYYDAFDLEGEKEVYLHIPDLFIQKLTFKIVSESTFGQFVKDVKRKLDDEEPNNPFSQEIGLIKKETDNLYKNHFLNTITYKDLFWTLRNSSNLRQLLFSKERIDLIKQTAGVDTQFGATLQDLQVRCILTSSIVCYCIVCLRVNACTGQDRCHADQVATNQCEALIIDVTILNKYFKSISTDNMLMKEVFVAVHRMKLYELIKRTKERVTMCTHLIYGI
tara:strand:- start:42 stop:1517 length:1476 start_codon:yes stop_codon:yes gene_type:complete